LAPLSNQADTGSVTLGGAGGSRQVVDEAGCGGVAGQFSRSVGPGQSKVLSTATGLIAAVCGVTAIVPFSDTAPRGLAAVLAVVGLGLAFALRRLAHRLTAGHVHLFLVFVTAVMTWCVAGSTTATGAVVTAVSFFWVAMYAAVFQTRTEMAVHLALVGAGLAYGLWSASPPSIPQSWLFLMGTITGVAWVLNGKVSGLRQDATRDELTGAMTRRGFLDVAAREIAWSARTGHPLTVVVLDLNGFKDINDRFGHAAGDAVLAGLPRAWAPSLRPRDVLGRLGGDEFALLMPGTDHVEAAVVVDRLRASSVSVTFAAGIVQWAGQDLEAWLAAADDRQYADKGRLRDTDDDGVPA
jgi:diguanylate cyclase (GGDEF)-like protein